MKQLLPIFILIIQFFNVTLKAQVVHNVVVSNFSFTPPVLIINQGDIVQWNNVAGMHNINGSLGTFPMNPAGFASGAPAFAPWSFSHTFTVLGMYNYQCDPHSGAMMGTVLVNGPLPIELKYISTQVKEGICKIEWASEKEENLADYILQSSENAIHFTDIVTIASNHTPSQYSYFHDMSIHRQLYYRLKITDNIGNEKYSPIQLALNDIKITKNELQISPNPYSDHFHIKLLSVGNWKGQVTVTNMQGQQLYNQLHTFAQGQNFIHLEQTQSYQKGIYLVSVKNENDQELLTQLVLKME